MHAPPIPRFPRNAWLFAIIIVSVRANTCVDADDLQSSMFCKGIVNYPFQMIGHFTLDDLNAQAVMRVGGYGLNATRAWYLLPTTCLASLKQLVCAETYIPCNATSLQPCPALCLAVDRWCAGLPTSPRDVGFVAHMTCNASSSNCYSGAEASVGTSIETYTGDMCTDYTRTFAVPTGFDDMNPLQAPGRVQSLLEDEARSLIAAVPSWASKACQSAASRLVCASLFPAATNYSLEHSHAVLPRVAALELCKEYADSCDGMIDKSVHYLDARLVYARNCVNRSIEIFHLNGGYKGYPERTEVVVDLELHYSLSTSSQEGFPYGKIMTRPYEDTSIAMRVSSQCVHGTSLITSGGDGIIEVEDTTCAVRCPIPYRSRNSIFMENVFHSCTSMVTLIASLYTAVTYTLVRERRRSQPLFALCFTLTWLRRMWLHGPYLIDVFNHGMREAEQKSLLCQDEMSFKTGNDGGMCSVQSYLLSSSVLGEYVTVMFIAFDVYVRVVFVPENPLDFVYKYYMPSVLFAVLLFVVLPLMLTGAAGASIVYGLPAPWYCIGRGDRVTGWYMQSYLRSTQLSFLCTAFFMVRGICKLINAMRTVKGMRTVRPASDKESKHDNHKRSNWYRRMSLDAKDIKMIKIPLVYLCFRTIEMSLLTAVYEFSVYTFTDSNISSLDEWYDCLFEHWFLVDTDQKAKCGEFPKSFSPRGGDGNRELYFSMLMLPDISYLFLFSLSRDSVRAWIKQHPSLEPLFCNLDKKADLLERLTSSVASVTQATVTGCESIVSSSQVVPMNSGDSPNSSSVDSPMQVE